MGKALSQKEVKELKGNHKKLKQLIMRTFKNINKESKIEIKPHPYMVNGTHCIIFKIRNKNEVIDGSITYRLID